MQTYIVSFERLSRFRATVTAEDADQALAEAMNALYVGRLEPIISDLSNFEAEAQT